MTDNTVLGEGQIDTTIVDGEVYINADQLAQLLASATVYLTAHFTLTQDEGVRGMAQGYLTLLRQADNLRAQALQDYAEASYSF
jgi:hypothetical protein